MRNHTLAPLGAAAILSLAGIAIADQLTVPSPEYPTIGDAVAAAVAGDEIVLLDGEFTDSANWNLGITEPITIRSDSADPASVVWIGPGFVSERAEDRALTISAEVTIEGITFRDFAGDVGGAILVEGGALTVGACRFEDNYNGDEFGCQDRLGGAIAALGGDLTVRDTVFTGNRSTHPACTGTGTAEGGAVYVRDGALTVERCHFESNRALGTSSGAGGAIATRDADAAIFGCAFVDNEVAWSDFARGGAISARGGTLTIARSRLEGNRCEAYEGASGGALSATGSTTVLSGVALVDNSAYSTVSASGGAAFLAGTIEASGLLVTGNGVTQLEPCDPTFGAEALGGGLYIRGDATLAHATIDGNMAECRGDNALVEAAGSLALANSVLRGDYEGAVTAEYSNVEGGLPGAGNIDAEPLYQPGSFRLASGSPGVDAGSVGLIPADSLDLDGDGDTTEPLPLDLDGLRRRVDDPATPDTGSGPAPIPDMGAYELQGCPADFDGDGELTLFDFLAFQNAFDAGDPAADFDGDGVLTLFDFLAFQNAFDAGCA
jgi:hypothetical protein